MTNAATARAAEAPDIETASADYATRFAGRVGAWLLEVQARAVLRGVASDRGVSILDVGGGHNQLAEPLVRAGYRVTVHGSAASCRARVSENPLTRDCPFVAGSALALPAGDCAYHTIVSVRMLAHVAEWRRLVAEYCRVAAREIVVDYPYRGGVNAIAPALFGAKQKIERNTRHWQAFGRGEVEAEFARHGFRVATSYRQFCLPMVLHRALRCRALSVLLEGICRAAGLTGWWGSPVVLKLVRAS